MPKATHNLSLGEGNYFSGKRPANTKNHSSKSPLLEPRLERTEE